MTDELKQQLSHLKTNLDSADGLDQDTIDSLNQVIEKMQDVVEQNKPVNEIEQTLETLVLDFEHNHPVIAEAIRDTINILGRIGV